MNFFKQIGREMNEKPIAVLLVYGIIFSIIQIIFPGYALQEIILLTLYEITRKINWAVEQIKTK